MGLSQTRSNLGQTDGGPVPEFRSDTRWQLVERILLTVPFQKSSNLHNLLTYLAEHSVRGKAEALTERQIGVTVFGKPADYSPAEDSAVRVHVRQLRLRLHEFFAQEGRNETLRVDIPKGSYMLEFRSPEAGPAAPADVEHAAPPANGKPQGKSIKDAFFWVAIAAAAVCAFGWFHAARQNAHRPAPWPLSSVIQPGAETRIVVSDANISTLRFLDSSEITLEQYAQPGFRESLIPQHVDPKMERLLNYVSRSELTSFADVAAATSLVKLAGPSGDQLVISAAQDLDRRGLAKSNYVFVGSPVSNPWTALFTDKLNFQIVEEGVGGRMYFRNTRPLPGEQAVYEGLTRTGSAGEDYATISLVPSRIGQGNVLVLEGLRQEGTEALGALLANAGDRGRLEQAVRKVAGNSPYFESLIRARAVAGAPVSIDIVATRAIQP